MFFIAVENAGFVVSIEIFQDAFPDLMRALIMHDEFELLLINES